MNTRPKAAKHDSVSKNEVALQAVANRAFEQAMHASREAEKGLSELARRVAELRDNDLWKHITDRNGLARFSRWTEVAKCLYGGKSDRSYYELIDCHSLTQGDAAIPAKEVQQYGIKRAVEIARLRPEQRTPEIRHMAKTEPVMAVRNKVQAILNTDLPKDEQKPMLKLLAINLPEDYVTEFEELIELLGHTDGARDGDSTQAIRAKAFNLMLIGAAEYWAQEIGAVMRQMKAEGAVHDSPASQSQEEQDFPDEGNEIETAASEEVATPKHSKDSGNVRRPRQLVLAE
jgi:hypothetical protein